VQPLELIALRHAFELIAHAKCESQIRTDVELVVEERGGVDLVSGERRRSDIALAEDVGAQVQNVALERLVIVAATNALREELRRNVLTALPSELHRVRALGPGHVVN